jgi:hypothetical protein
VLIKVTNRCSMGCSHCLEDSTPNSAHMPWEGFLEALDFTQRIEGFAWEQGCPSIILLSGGECTEHPDIVRMVEEVISRGWAPMLLTNGLWLENEELREALLRPEVTNDPRFYPKAPPKVDDHHVVYVDSLTVLIPLGRGRRESEHRKGVPLRKGPSSFNLRSLTRGLGDVVLAVAALRARAGTGLAGHCIPSISVNGDVMAGESNNCFKVGTVHSSIGMLAEAISNMQCNRCGLENNLTQEQKRAIGASVLFAADE